MPPSFSATFVSTPSKNPECVPPAPSWPVKTVLGNGLRTQGQSVPTAGRCCRWQVLLTARDSSTRSSTWSAQWTQTKRPRKSASSTRSKCSITASNASKRYVRTAGCSALKYFLIITKASGPRNHSPVKNIQLKQEQNPQLTGQIRPKNLILP